MQIKTTTTHTMLLHEGKGGKKSVIQAILSILLVALIVLLAACSAPPPVPTELPAPPTLERPTETPLEPEEEEDLVIPETGITETVEESQERVEAADQVGQWQVYEITLTSTASYGNPFTDVDVYADFTSENKNLRVYGFYDGNGSGGHGNLWKIRFMTGDIGSWSWETRSTDSGNSGLHNQAGSLTVVQSNQPGPVHPDPAYPNSWIHANGDRFYWNLGYSIHILGSDRTHAGVGGWQDYLDWLQAKRFNGVMFTLQVPSFKACTTCSKGVAPWDAIGSNPAPKYANNNNGTVDYYIMPWASKSNSNNTASGGSDADFTRFYLPFWNRVDELLAEMQNKGMIANVFMYDDETFWPNASSSQERLYWNYIIRRMGAYWNVVYNDGIDLNEYRSLSNWVNEWQQYFSDNDPFNHARSSRHGNDDGQASTWRSMQAADASRPANIDQWYKLMDQSPRKPVTEDDGIRARKSNGISADRFMQLAWWSVLSGPGGLGATWAGAYDPGNWYSNLDSESEGMRRVAIRNKFILGEGWNNGNPVPFWKMQVMNDLVTGDNVYSSAVLGESYLVYFDAGSPNSTEVDLNDTSTPLTVKWLNPQNGDIIDGGESEPGKVQTFTKPFNGPAVLYLGGGIATATQPHQLFISILIK